MILKSKTIVVTGAGSGIGAAITRELIKRDAVVVALDVRKEGLKDLANDLNNSEKLKTFILDITDRNAVARLPETIIENVGQVDGIINNAGIIQPFVKVMDLDYKDIEKVMNVNFYGALNMIKAFLPELLKRPEAHIVNVSSMGGFLPVPGQSVYGASKAAIKLLSEGLYAELLETSVNVTTVFPGATKTDITKNSGVNVPSGNSSSSKEYPALSADKAAKIIIDGIEKNKPQIFTGSDSKSMNRLYRMNPVFATKFIAKKMRSLLG